MRRLLLLLTSVMLTISLIGCGPAAPTLNGDADMTIEVGTPYEEPGLSNYSEGVTITGEVDVNTVGIYTVTYSVTQNDVTLSIDRRIAVVDTTEPVVTLNGSDVLIEQGGTYTDSGATAEDNYDGDLTDSITVDSTVDTSTPGTYTVTYSVTDSSGNTGSATRNVTVTEVSNVAPVISITGDSVVSVYVGDTWTDPGATAIDNEDGDLTAAIIVGGDTVDTSTEGSYTITYDVSDSDGLAATTVSRTVNVVVNQAPVITLTGDASVRVFVGDTWTDPGAIAMDTEDGDISTDIIATGTVDTTTVGIYTIEYDVTDSQGLAATTVTRTVEVTTNSDPVIELSGLASYHYYTGWDAWDEPGYTASDPEDGDITSSVVVTGTVNKDVVDTYVITYSVTDSDGNTVSTTRTVIVTDVANGPTVLTLNGEDTVTLVVGDTWTDPGATAIDPDDGDISDDIIVTGEVDLTTAGTYTLQYDVYDSYGQRATSVSRTVIVLASNEAPVITLDGDTHITIYNGDGYFEPGFTATDHEDGDVTVNVVVTGIVDPLTAGTYILEYDVTDSDGNGASTVYRSVTVIDNTAPVITLTGEDTITLTIGDTWTDPGATAIDAQDGDVTSDITIGGDTVDTSTAGTYIIEYDVIDSRGTHSVYVYRTVIVNPPTDTDPEVALIGDAIIFLTVGDTWTEPGVTATDVEDGDLSNAVVIGGDTVDTTTANTYVITYTITDSDGNTTSTQRTVVVEEVTNTHPVINVDSPLEVHLGLNDPFTIPDATASDLEDGDLTNQVVVNGAVDTSVYGTYTIDYTVIDSDGNTTVVVVTVYVEDNNQAPVIELSGNNPLTMYTYQYWSEPGYTVTDDSDVNLGDSLVVTGTVDDTTPGIYVLTYTVTDSGGLTDEVTRTVYVLSSGTDTDPVLTINGDNPLTILQGQTGMNPGATAWDDEDGVITDDVYDNFDYNVDINTPGTYVVDYWVYDWDSNYVTAQLIVTVEAYTNTDPVITLNGDLVVELDEGDSYTDLGATATDAEDGDLTSAIITDNPVDTTVPGEYTVTYQVTDVFGVTVIETRTVIVHQTYAPEVQLLGNDVIYINVFDTYTEPGYTATDVEDGSISSAVVVIGTVNTDIPGEYNIQYKVVDSDGKEASAFRKVVVLNNIAGDYGMILIQQGLDVPWVDVLTDIGLPTDTVINIDQSVVGDTFLVIDNHGYLFRIFEPGRLEVSFTPDMILYTGPETFVEANMALYEDTLVTFQGDQFAHTRFTAGIGYSVSVVSQDTYGVPIDTEASFSAGVYDLHLEIEDVVAAYYTFKVQSASTVTNNAVAASEGFTYSYLEAMIQTYTFTSTGGDMQIAFSNYSPFNIVIKDSSGNTIIEEHNVAHAFDLTQNFAAGDYIIEVTFLQPPNASILYLSNSAQANYGPEYAMNVPLDTTMVLPVLHGMNWFSFTIPTSGYYNFGYQSSSMEYTDVTLFDSGFRSIYFDSYQYFTAGTYYLRFYGVGEVTAKIYQDTVVTTTNDDEANAILVVPGTVYETTVTSVNNMKWYQLDVSTTAIYEIITSLVDDSKQGIVTLYDASGNELAVFEDDAMVHLEVATYYLILEGTLPDSTISLLVKEHQADPIPTDTASRGTITIGEEERWVVYRGEYGRFALTITEDGFFRFNMTDGVSMNLILYTDDDVLHRDYVYPGDLFVYALEAGTYYVDLQHQDNKATIVAFSFAAVEDRMVGYSDTFSDAPYVDRYQSQFAFVKQYEEVFQRIHITEPSLMYGHYMNAAYLRIYDLQGNVLKEGNPWGILPILFEPGDYVIGIVAEYNGILKNEETWFEPVYDYGKDKANATVLSDFTHLFGYVGDSTVDTFQFTLTEERAYMISKDYNNTYQMLIVNDQDEVFFELDQETANAGVILPAGTYYAIVNTTAPFYQIYVTDVTRELAPTTELEAKEIYTETELTTYLRSGYDEGYFTFTVSTDRILNLEIDGNMNTHYEVTDAAGTIVTGQAFTAGTYTVRIYQQFDNNTDIAFPIPVYIDLEDITDQVLSNTMATAEPVDMDLHMYISGYLPKATESSWYTFTNPNDFTLVLFVRSGSPEMTLYDDQMNEIDFDMRVQLDAGTYYIELAKDPLDYGEDYDWYDLNFEMLDNVDQPGVCNDITDVFSFTEGVLHLSGVIVNSDDQDCYKIALSEDMKISFTLEGWASLYEYDILNDSTSYLSTGTRYAYMSQDYLYVIVYNNSNFSEYDLWVYSDPTVFHEGTVQDATELPLNEQVEGYFATIGEVDYFTFTLDTAQELTFLISQPFAVYDSTETEITDLTAEFPTGTYYIAVTAGTTGFYYTTIYSADYEPETPPFDPGWPMMGGPEIPSIETTIEAPWVLMDPYQTLAFDPMGASESDFFLFTINLPGFLQISDNKWGVRVRIYDETGENVLFEDAYFEDMLVYLTTGTYILEVTDSWGDYSITLSRHEYKDYSDDSTAPYDLFMYEFMDSYLIGAGDTDYATFTLNNDYIVCLNNPFGVIVEIVDVNGTIMIDTANGLYCNDLHASIYTMTITNPSSDVYHYRLGFDIERLDHVYLASRIDLAEEVVIDTRNYTVLEHYSQPTTSEYFKIILTRDSYLDIDDNLTLVDGTGAVMDDTIMIPAGTYYLKTNSYLYGFYQHIVMDMTDYVADNTDTTTHVSVDTQETVFAYGFDSTTPETYQFAATTDGVLYFKDVTNYYGTVTITDGLGQVLFTGYVNAYDYDHITIKVFSGENYVLSFDGFSGFYHFTLASDLLVDAPDVEANAIVIELEDGLEEYLIYDMYDEDWFTFTVTENVILYLDYAVTYDILDNTGAVYTTHPANDEYYNEVPAGTYHVRIYNTVMQRYTIDLGVPTS